MTRVYDAPDAPVIKGRWTAEIVEDRYLKRSRLVWLQGIPDAVAKETRIDTQETDDWVEVSLLSAAYLRHLKSVADQVVIPPKKVNLKGPTRSEKLVNKIIRDRPLQGVKRSSLYS